MDLDADSLQPHAPLDAGERGRQRPGFIHPLPTRLSDFSCRGRLISSENPRLHARLDRERNPWLPRPDLGLRVFTPESLGSAPNAAKTTDSSEEAGTSNKTAAELTKGRFMDHDSFSRNISENSPVLSPQRKSPFYFILCDPN